MSEYVLCNKTDLVTMAEAVRASTGSTSSFDVSSLSARVVSLLSGVETDTIEVPAYWQTHLNEQILNIEEALKNAGSNNSSFLWYTDAHWTSNKKSSPALLKYLAQNSSIKNVNFGGDIVDAESETVAGLIDVYDWRSKISGLVHHSVVGNHDDGNIVDDRWTKEDIYSFLLKPEETSDIVRGADLYYYRDDNLQKTRYIYLDSATKTGNIYYDTNQQNFLKQTLISTPNNWHIIPIAHIWLNVDYTQNPPVATTPSYGGQWMLDQFDAYNMRTGDYANCGARVEFCIGGHSHVDNNYRTPSGIPVVLTACDASHVRDTYPCVEGTISENSVNAIIADYKNNKINVIRIGRGESRVVELRPPDYTNQLPIATDLDGNIYNGIGYKPNTRMSSSSKVETTATGWYLTGYIPATKNDIIRIKNAQFMDMNDSLSGTDRSQVYFFYSDKSWFTITDNYTPTNLMPETWEAEYGEDGNLIKFKIPSTYNSTVAYIRIGFAYLDENSIITVNEEITDGGTSEPEDTPTTSYTNVLKTATDTDGSLYNGGTGYKDNVRWSTTSSAETSATGWDITGYIRATGNDILRFANLSLIDPSASTARSSLFYFNEDYSYLDCSSSFTSPETMHSDFEVVTDASGEVVQMKVPSYIHGTYIRIVANDINENSIITVNEEITGTTEEINPSYTNYLPIATDASGAVYNSTGFKANTRFSTSSKAEVEGATGWYLTGYIPCKKNDVVRLKNMEFLDMDGSNGATSRSMIYLFNTDKSYNTCSTSYTPSSLMSSAWEAVYGDDGNLVQFKLPSSYDSSVGYIRIGAAYIDENSIITINEEIT